MIAKFTPHHNLKEGALKIVIAVLSLSLVACTSSRTYVASPMESEINGERYHYHNLVVLKDKASMFHVTESRSWMEYCKKKIETPVTQDEWDYPYQDCVMHSQYMANGAPSVAQQAVTPVVTTAIGAAGFATGMHLLSRGIAKSGDQTTNNNNTSSDGGSSSATGGTASASSSAKSAAKGGASSATNNVNSGNKTTNHNHNKSTTNINSNNKVQMKFNQHLNNH